ncbi:TPA: DUF2178 domain-containing protein [Methanosarcinaceae archaeon]|nr:DUF2178 domain-containing protein [Methanosarcinaceae archaeon]
MKKNRFKVISLLIVMGMSVVVSFAVSIGNPVLAIGVVFVGMAAMYLNKKRLEDVLEDERAWKVGQMASRATLHIVALGFALGGAVFIAMRTSYPEYSDLGFFLAYTSCGIMVLYTLFYMYYNREYGA